MRNRGFALTAVVVLALGVGACVAIFAFVDAALLEPLPYLEPNRLMSVNESSRRVSAMATVVSGFSRLAAVQSNRFLSLDVYSGRGYLLRAHEGAEPVTGGAGEREILSERWECGRFWGATSMRARINLAGQMSRF